MITKKTVSVEVQFAGSGRVVQRAPNVFSGGVVEPELGSMLRFVVRPEVLDEDGLLNPSPDSSTVDGAFQINVEGTAEGYRELARYLLGIAELDTVVDPGFHEHHEVLSDDGRTHLHLILRKRPDAATSPAV